MHLKMSIVAISALMLPGAAMAQEDEATPQPVPAPAVMAAVDATTPAADPENTLALDLSTGGRVLVRLRPEAAPNHVARIKELARQGFYNNIVFHRVIDGFMAQTGDPTGTGEGESRLPDVNAEFNRLPHVRGAVSMARTNEPNSANSQFFIMLAPRLTLDGNYSVFGRVIEGMEFVDAIPRGEPPPAPARIVRASIQADNVSPPSPAEIAAANQPPPPPPTNAAAAIDAALGAQTTPSDPALSPPITQEPDPGASPADALDAAAETENAAQNDTGTAADPTTQPPETSAPDEAAVPPQ